MKKLINIMYTVEGGENMNYVLDILACATVCIAELLIIFAIGIIIQGLVYRLTGFSIFNAIKNSIIKGI